MSASLAMKPSLSQRFYEWLAAVFAGSEPRLVAATASRCASKTVSAAMPNMGRALPDDELAEVEIVRPRPTARLTVTDRADARDAVSAALARLAAGVDAPALQLHIEADATPVADAAALAERAPATSAQQPQQREMPAMAARLAVVAARNHPEARKAPPHAIHRKATVMSGRAAARRRGSQTPRPVVSLPVVKSYRAIR